MSNSDVILWLKEAISRLGQKSPSFFKVVGTISLICAILGAIPDILTMIGVALPTWAEGTYTKVMFFVGVWGKIVSAFAVQAPAQAILPFSEKKAQEKIDSLNSPIK